MSSFQRAQVATLCERLAEPPSRIIALFGPRQTGKTTVVRQALRKINSKSRYFAVDEPEPATPRIPSDMAEATFSASQQRDTAWLVRNWEEARLEAEQSGGFVLVFDEIQKIRTGLRPSRACGMPTAPESVHYMLLSWAQPHCLCKRE